ncbi:MAG: hypothetical protein ACNA8W_09360 [Bradymonadaceae bacterium]
MAAAPHPLESTLKFDFIQLSLVGLTVVAMGCLYAAIHTNLLFDVNMQVSGSGCSNSVLRWYVDRATSILPTAGIISLPIWIWRGLMLLWALWLSWKLLKWAPWAWQAFSAGGLWKPLRNQHLDDDAGTALPVPPQDPEK